MATNKRRIFLWFSLWVILILISFMLPAEITVGVSMFLAGTNVFIMEFRFNDTLARPLVSILSTLGIVIFAYCVVGFILELSCQAGIELGQSTCSNSHLRVGLVIIHIVVAFFSSIMMSAAIHLDKRKLFL